MLPEDYGSQVAEIQAQLQFMDELGRIAVDQLRDLMSPPIITGLMLSVTDDWVCVECCLLGEEVLMQTISRMAKTVEEVERLIEPLRLSAPHSATTMERSLKEAVERIQNALDEASEETLWP